MTKPKAAVLFLLLLLGCLQPAQAVTLADFGYTNLTVNGKAALGHRPMLLICVNFTGQSPLPNSLSYYSNLVFNTGQFPTLNGFYNACSDGAFSFSPAGAVMVTMPNSLNFTNVYAQFPAPPNPFATADERYASNIIRQAMSSATFNFKNFDANHDGHVTVDELAILIIVSDSGWTLGGARNTPVVLSPDGTYDWGGGSSHPNVSLLSYLAPFIVMAEETEETLGTPDIYNDNCYSQFLSSQSCFDPNHPENLYYLDPWNRMQLGWCQPRIFSLIAGGIANISAAQAGDPTSPIILYDPTPGREVQGEFFLLEYRTHTNSLYGPGYDHDVLEGASDGLVIWIVGQDFRTHQPFNLSTQPSQYTRLEVWSENPPDLSGGPSSALWGSNSTTPPLQFVADPFHFPIQIKVLPFVAGANSITVEWLALDSWVDFSYGFPDFSTGAFNAPFITFKDGVNETSYGGTLHLKQGDSKETGFFSKPMHIVPYNGPVTIGR